MDTKDKANLLFDEEPKYRELLKNFQLDELMLTAILLPERRPKSIPKDKKALIQICINEMASIRNTNRARRLNDNQLSNKLKRVQASATTTDESSWIKDPMPKRLEMFLRDKFSYDWIDVDGISNKKHFLLMYNLQKIQEDGRNEEDKPISLRALKRSWPDLESLNELKGLTEADSKDFLEHFSKEYKKTALENDHRPTLRKVDSINLETAEDALIWLDFFSHNPLERSAITDKIRKSWQQKQYRKTSGKTQKNFHLSKATISTLKTLADEYGLNETEVITILIKEELKNDIYIKEVLTRANALQRAIEGE